MLLSSDLHIIISHALVMIKFKCMVWLNIPNNQRFFFLMTTSVVKDKLGTRVRQGTPKMPLKP